MTTARAIWHRFGTTDAISVPAFLVSFAAGLIGNFVTSADSMDLWLRLVVLAVAQIAMLLPLSVCWLLLRRNPDRSHPWAVAAALVLGLGLRALVIGSAFSVLVGPDAAEWAQRFIGAVVNIGLAYALCAVLVTALRERRREIVELKSTRAQLARSLDQAAAGFSERNEHAVESVCQVLADALDGLDSRDAGATLAALQHTASEVVRPLSHELAATSPSFDADDLAVVVEKTTWPEILDSAATGKPFRPIATTIVLGFELVGAAVAYPAGAWWLPFAGLLTALLLAVVNIPLSTLLVGRDNATRIGLVIAASVIVGLLVGFATRLALGDGRTAVNVAIGLACFVVLFALGTTVVAAVFRDRDRVIVELSESADALQRSLVRMRQAQWFQQKALSRALHGPIQVAVTAAALRLDAAMQQGRMTSTVIEDTRRELLEIVDVLREPDLSVASVESGLARISGVWDGLCSVSLRVDDLAQQHLDSDSMLRSCVIDIASEAVSNAVRHGAATHVEVVLEPGGDVGQDLKLVVASDGRIRESASRRGLGTQLLDDCTLSWTGEFEQSGYRLVALLPAA